MSHVRRDRCRRLHADGHRLAVQQRAVPGGRLERVADGVPVVEQHALAALAFVAFDDVGLELDCARDDWSQRFARSLV